MELFCGRTNVSLRLDERGRLTFLLPTPFYLAQAGVALRYGLGLIKFDYIGELLQISQILHDILFVLVHPFLRNPRQRGRAATGMCDVLLSTFMLRRKARPHLSPTGQIFCLRLKRIIGPIKTATNGLKTFPKSSRSQSFLDASLPTSTMTLITRFVNNLLRLALIVPLVHATNYSQPLPCLGFCLALDPSLIRRDDGVSDWGVVICTVRVSVKGSADTRAFQTYFRYNTNGGIYFQKSSGTGSAGIAGPWVDSGPALPGGSIMDRSVANLWVSDPLAQTRG